MINVRNVKKHYEEDTHRGGSLSAMGARSPQVQERSCKSSERELHYAGVLRASGLC